MRLHNVAAFAACAVFMCGSASARRGVSVDSWQPGPNSVDASGTSLVFNSTSTLASGALPSWVSSLTLTPGTSIPGGSPNVSQPTLPAGDMWTYASLGDDGTFGGEEAIILPTANSLTVEFEYAALSCSKETASMSLNGMSFSAVNPCVGGVITTDPEGNTFNLSTLVFGLNSSGKVSLEGALPTGWSAAAAAAPELGSSGVINALMLMGGGIAMAFGRRRRETERH